MHSSYLKAALQQAYLGLGFCAPNPSVGAVVVCDRKIVASGYHAKAGEPHAEVAALAKLAPQHRNISLYVTLEPCNHWGKTPPCTDAILQAHQAHGVKEVVFAYRDPNPLVSQNNSEHILSRAGIAVLYLPVPEIEQFYQAYRRFVCEKMPYVRAKLALDLAGNSAGPEGKPVKITGKAVDVLTHQYRKQSDAILTTATTVLRDNPRLDARTAGQCFPKPIFVLDTQGRLTGQERIFCYAAKVIVLGREGALAQADTVSVPKAADGRLCLVSVLARIAEMGYHSVWVEAGATLFNALHAESLVQETLLYVSAKNFGPSAHRAALAALKPEHAARTAWQVFDETAVLQLNWES